YDRAKAMVCGNCNLDVPLRCNVTWSIQQLRLNVKRHVGHVELAKLTFWHESDKKPKGIKYARLQENKVLEGPGARPGPGAGAVVGARAGARAMMPCYLIVPGMATVDQAGVFCIALGGNLRWRNTMQETGTINGMVSEDQANSPGKQPNDILGAFLDVKI
uniref:Uncharacterized protein n=1 Tax=Parascaris univalens TaxID=6257 RepID=A0A915CIT6_PARUN